MSDDNIKLKRDILKKRAVELAREADQSLENDKSITIVEFLLNDEIYGFEVSYIKQTLNLNSITPVPCTPSFVIGLINLQEIIVSVVDIRSFFQMSFKGISNLNKVIVLEKGNMVFGIAADQILGINKVFLKDIQKSIDTFDDARKKYFYGLSNTQTIILDAGKILSDTDILVK